MIKSTHRTVKGLICGALIFSLTAAAVCGCNTLLGVLPPENTSSCIESDGGVSHTGSAPGSTASDGTVTSNGGTESGSSSADTVTSLPSYPESSESGAESTYPSVSFPSAPPVSSDSTGSSDVSSSGGNSSNVSSSGGNSSNVSSSGGNSSNVSSSGGNSSNVSSSGGNSSNVSSSGGNSSNVSSSGGNSSDVSSGGNSSDVTSAPSEDDGYHVDDGFVPGNGIDTVIINTKKPAAIKPLQYYWRSTLKGDALSVYDTVAETGAAYETLIDIADSIRMTTDEFKHIIELYLLDHPENFWWSKNYVIYTNTSTGYVTKVTVKLAYDMDTVRLMQAEIDAAVNSILAGLPETATDFEVEHYFHDWLAKNVKYVVDDEDAATYNLYGGLVRGQGVCEAYSEAMQYLCHRVGIPAMGITGKANNGSGEYDHKWLGIYIGGHWYMVDPTWDDTDNDDAPVRHTYLNMTSNEIEKNHRVDATLTDGLPDFDTHGASFYEYYGLLCNPEHDPVTELFHALDYFGSLDHGESFIVELHCADDDCAKSCMDYFKGNNWHNLTDAIDAYNEARGTDYRFARKYYQIQDMTIRIFIKE